MQLAASQFLRALRGSRSQLAFARRLGFKGNPIADWEAGRRAPTAEFALAACKRVGIPVTEAFARFINIPLRSDETQYALGTWLDQLRGSSKYIEVAERSGHSRHQVRRWLQGGALPRLPEFFRLVDAMTGRLSELVAELVPIEKVPSLSGEYARVLAARQLAHDEPWTEALLRLLETRAYQDGKAHHAGKLSASLGISIETETRCLTKLEKAGIIERRNEKFVVIRSLSVDTRALPQLKAHWSEVAQARTRAPQAGDVFCYNVLSASEADLEKIQKVLLGSFREIRAIVANTKTDEGAALVNLQMVRWQCVGGTSEEL